MTQLTASDFADTGQWRLRISIFKDGMSAYLENLLHKDLEPQLLFKTEWEDNEGSFLSNLENAVYENPRVLDDFAASIIIYDRKTLFMPTELSEIDPGSEEDYYMALYPCDINDIMTDRENDLTAIWSPGKGVKSFLLRTFPGALITSNLMDSVRYKRRINRGLTMFVDQRGNETDYVFLNSDKLIGAATHSTDNPAEVLYHALNIIDVSGIDPKDVVIQWKGPEPGEAVGSMLELFKQYRVVGEGERI